LIFKKKEIAMKKSYLLSGMIVLGIAASVNANQKAEEQITALMLQVAKQQVGWEGIFKILGHHKGIVNMYHMPAQHDMHRPTLLSEAVSSERHDVVKELLEKYNADPNMAVGMEGVYTERTPLMQAAIVGNLGIVKLLLEHGADPYIMDNLDDKRDVLQLPGVDNTQIRNFIQKWMNSHPMKKSSFVYVTK
jgi:ankyrin repeat protein